MDQVILVDEQDNETGLMEKIEAHKEGRLHRAISVFIFNSKNELLLQKRAAGKYHSGGLWTNTCCSHPHPGETAIDAANRRLYQEMGLNCELKEIFSFIYKARMDNDLTEYEYDHVFTGIADTIPHPDATEIADWKYFSYTQLETDIKKYPEKYTEWFKICFRDWRRELFGQL